MSETSVRFSLEEAHDLAVRALKACGANDRVANSLAAAAVDADRHGHHGQGLDHLDPYCDGLLKGRIDGAANPEIEVVTPALIRADANGGIAHLAYDLAFGRLCAAARELGIAAYSCRNSFTCGELGWFVRRLSDAGLAGFAATNGGPALLAASGATKPVFCTNPMAFAIPAGDGKALLIDQSSSSTAFVNIRHAAASGQSIPLGWALDSDGNPTDDPKKAIDGVLLAYGGSRGANMALMVELMAAGLSGANWSIDAPAFHHGNACPGVGQLVIALDPARFAGDGFEPRLRTYLTRLQTDFDVHLPGQRKYEAREKAAQQGLLLENRVVEALKSYIER